MQVNVIVIDDFLNNPDDVRAYAMEQEYNKSGNYPGVRTGPIDNPDIVRVIGDILRPHGGEITEMLGNQYQWVNAANKSWVHVDNHNNWAGVLYLTPDAPPEGGTAFYKHKRLGVSAQFDHNKEICDEASTEGSDFTKWDKTDVVANVYNRLILFRSHQFHSSMEYFGRNFENSRLFQVFFISTEH